ncbi:MAG: class I SAM-dependent methyltransferase [bacterium]
MIYQNSEFYDNLSEFYDGMIDFKKSLVKKSELLKNFTGGCKSALDVGCGTGVDSIALALNGLKVTAIDPSPKMIERAVENAFQSNVEINFINGVMENVDLPRGEYFDIAVSLGNAAANIPTDELIFTLQKIHDMLGSGGKLLIQILNYDLILEKQERIVNISKSGENYIVRFYDFEWDIVRFNILVFNEKDRSNYQMFSSQIFTHTKCEMGSILKDCGFSNIELFGGLDKSVFDPGKSKDLIMAASK